MRFPSSLLACTAFALSIAAPPAGADPNGCRHASAADVTKALGSTVAPKESVGGPGVDACTYRTPSMLRYVVLTSSRVPAGTTDGAEFARVTNMSAGLFGVKPLPFRGVGDQAVTITHILWVRRGKSIYSINVVEQGGPALQIATAAKIARALRD